MGGGRVSERTTVEYGDRGVRYVYITAGYASTATCIMQAESLDLCGVRESGANCCEDVSELFVLPDGEIPVCILSVGAAWGDLVVEGSSARVCWSG